MFSFINVFILFKQIIFYNFPRYSNCQTKLWDVMSGETCVFQPSSTALVIDEAEEEGTINNEVLHVATCTHNTAASYMHGKRNVIDINHTSSLEGVTVDWLFLTVNLSIYAGIHLW